MALNDGKQKSLLGPAIDVVAAVVLGSAALGAFVLQVVIGRGASSAETALFNALQFVLTLGFGWFSTRAITRSEFERGVKQFAVSAYRRAADIEKILSRLQRLLSDVRAQPSESHEAGLAAVGASVDDALLVVKSSATDWSDVIGAEIVAFERLRELERERSEIEQHPSEEQAAAIERLRSDIAKEIATVRAALPPQLLLEAKRAAHEDRQAEHIARWFAREHARAGGYKLEAFHGPGMQTTQKDFSRRLN